MSALLTLSRMLGLPARHAEHALYSERAARASLSRRGLFAAGAALAAGSVLVGGPLPLICIENSYEHWLAHSWADYRDQLQAQGINDEAPWFTLSEVLADSSERPMREILPILWDTERQEITDSSHTSLKLPLWRWAEREGRGLLCTTEF